MNLSCPELALYLPADLLWLRHMAHELSHPCPPPSSSSQRGKNSKGKLSAANPLRCVIPGQGLARYCWATEPLPTPWLTLAVQGHHPQCWDPSGSPSQGPEQQHCCCLGILGWAWGVCCSRLTPLPKTVVTSQPRCFVSEANAVIPVYICFPSLSST